MQFKHFGDENKPVVVLLHGGGLSWWMWEPHIAMLNEDYHFILPIIDGHDIDDITFSNISDSSDHLIQHIEKTCGGQVFALCGLSLGAQIALDVLAKRPDMAKYALIESALTEPMGWIAEAAIPLVGLSYGLVAKRWFSRAQAKAMLLPDPMFETYFESSKRISKESLLNITRANAAFRVNPALGRCSTKTLILAGGKEVRAIKNSARALGKTLPNAAVRLLAGYRHGELSIGHPDEYVQVFSEWVLK